MSDNISWNIQLTVNDGHLDDLKSLMAEMIDSTDTNESGTLQYEWFMSDDETTLHVNERYTNADAMMVHIGNFGAHFAERFMTYLTIQSFTIYGAATDDIKDALDPLGAAFFAKLGGFSK